MLIYSKMFKIVKRYFNKEDDGKYKCNFCSRKLSVKSRSTPNLERHLKAIHPAIYSKIHISKLKNSQASTSHIERNAEPGKENKRVSKTKEEDINFSLICFIVKNFLPFRIVETPCFKAFVTKLNHSYKLPCRNTISSILIPRLYETEIEKLRFELNQIDACCLTFDRWTSTTNESYLCMTIHYINSNFHLQSKLIDCYQYNEKHSAQNFSKELIRITREWDIYEKVVAVVSDNGANIVAAVHLIEKWTHIHCYVHTLNLIVLDALKEIKQLQRKVKTIDEFFKSSQSAHMLKCTQLDGEDADLHVKQDVITRWNSTYDMFERILAIKDSINTTIKTNYPNQSYVSEDDANALKNTCILLKMFKDVTSELSNEKQVTISKIIIITNSLKNHCGRFLENKDNHNADVARLCEKLLTSLENRFELIECDTIYAEAMLLDPRFKKFGFTNTVNFTKAYTSLLDNLSRENLDTPLNTHTPCSMSTNINNGIWSEFDANVSQYMQDGKVVNQKTEELDRYLGEALLPRTEDPLLWWKRHETLYPCLHKLVKKRLCIAATSVPSERIVSKTGQIVTQQRNQLSGNKVREIVFLNNNLE